MPLSSAILSGKDITENDGSNKVGKMNGTRIENHFSF
jgi:hypothetical protein